MVFGHIFRYFFNKLKLVPEDAPRREERKLEKESNFPRGFSINFNKPIAWDSSTENLKYNNMKTV